MTRRDEPTGTIRSSTGAATAEMRSVHRLARALLSSEGHRILVVTTDAERALALCKRLVSEGACDSFACTTNISEARDWLAYQRFDAVAIEQEMRDELYLNGAGPIVVILNGHDDDEIVNALRKA